MTLEGSKGYGRKEHRCNTDNDDPKGVGQPETRIFRIGSRIGRSLMWRDACLEEQWVGPVWEGIDGYEGEGLAYGSLLGAER